MGRGVCSGIKGGKQKVWSVLLTIMLPDVRSLAYKPRGAMETGVTGTGSSGVTMTGQGAYLGPGQVV